jgi:hypothetical protein
MTRRLKNPFSGVSRIVDRHGKVRWQFRATGADLYLPGAYASVEFRAAYESARSGGAASLLATLRNERGSFNWLIEEYKRTPK